MSKEKMVELFLDWFNNFISTEKFREYHNLSISECENVLDVGRKLYNENPKKYSHFIK